MLPGLLIACLLLIFNLSYNVISRYAFDGYNLQIVYSCSASQISTLD